MEEALGGAGDLDERAEEREAVEPAGGDVGSAGALVGAGGGGDEGGDVGVAPAEGVVGAVDVHGPTVGVAGGAGEDGFEAGDQAVEEGGVDGVEGGGEDFLGGPDAVEGGAVGVAEGGDGEAPAEEALAEVLTGLPPDAPGVVMVLHMPEGFTASYAQRLDGICRVRVREARNGDRVLPGHVLLEHFETPMSPDRLQLPLQAGPDGSFRVTIDAGELVRRQVGGPLHHEGRGIRPWHVLVPFADRRRAVVVHRTALASFAPPRNVDGHRVAWRAVHGDVFHLAVR